MGNAFRWPSGNAMTIKIKNYSAEEAIPAWAVENTVAMVSSTSPSKVIIDYARPALGQEGDVWLVADAVSTRRVKLLKCAEIYFPLYAVMQYTNGMWVKRKGFIFSQGNWAELGGEVIIYQYGNDPYNLTQTSISRAAFYKNIDHLLYESQHDTGPLHYLTVQTAKRVLLTGVHTQLYFYGERLHTCNAESRKVDLYVIKPDGTAAKTGGTNMGYGAGELHGTIDITGLEGEYYIRFAVSSAYNWICFKTYEILLR